MNDKVACQPVMTKALAPVAVFAYNRPHHLSRCFESLLANQEAIQSPLYVFCDGPRTSRDASAVDGVRSVARQVKGFASVTLRFREQNVGLARSIVDGLDELLISHDQVIVVEDDLLLSSHFLRYMNDALSLYATISRVASIHGYCYPVRTALPETFFLRGADCWGWATWRRAWSHFRADGAALLRELKEQGLSREFDLDGAYPFTRMLSDQVEGRNDSWAIRWHASCYLKDLLTLYPGRSLVRNIGNDSSGTHSKTTSEFDVELAQTQVIVNEIPLVPNVAARDAFIRFLRPTLLSRISRVASVLRSCLKTK